MEEDDFLTAREALVRSEDHFQSALDTKKSLSKSTQDADIAAIHGKPEKHGIPLQKLSFIKVSFMTGRYSVDPYKDYLHTDYTFKSYPA